MDLKLKGKRALVMGASQGIGRAIAQTLAAEGAQVAICSRDEKRIQDAAKAIGAHQAFACDLSAPGGGEKAVKEAVKRLGGLDVLVVNSGGPAKAPFMETTNAQWADGFQSLWLCTVDSIRAAIPEMRKHAFGRILVVTSAAAIEPMPSLNVSNGLRAGLHGMVKSLSNEVAAEGITVNALAPGFTDTERLRELGIPAEKITAQIPARRLGKPEELGAVAAFLASDWGAYITGQAIAIDGGYLKGI